jgi:hypothetical protein
VESLANHLNSNETIYAKLPEFRDYYGRNGSPVKRERSSPAAPVTVTKTTRRRTIIKEPAYVIPQARDALRVEIDTFIVRRSPSLNVPRLWNAPQL